jgi:hypothetical protein
MRKDAVRFGGWAGMAISPPSPSICPIAVACVAASGAVALFYRFDNAVVGEKEEVAGKQCKSRFIMRRVQYREQSDEGNYDSLLEPVEMFVKRKAFPKRGTRGRELFSSPNAATGVSSRIRAMTYRLFSVSDESMYFLTLPVPCHPPLSCLLREMPPCSKYPIRAHSHSFAVLLLFLVPIAPIRQVNYDKTKTPAEAPFFDLGFKNYFALQTPIPQGLRKIRKEFSCKKPLLVIYICILRHASFPRQGRFTFILESPPPTNLIKRQCTKPIGNQNIKTDLFTAIKRSCTSKLNPQQSAPAFSLASRPDRQKFPKKTS